MNIIPKDKHDLESISSLDSIPNDELEPYLPELLVWIQDMNWPVAGVISKRLSKSGREVVEPIKKVLKSDDAIWKYFVITGVVEHLSKDVREELMDEIIRIVNNPSIAEAEEEVDLVARDIIVMCSHGI